MKKKFFFFLFIKVFKFFLIFEIRNTLNLHLFLLFKVKNIFNKV